jgi:hypothetical protein
MGRFSRKSSLCFRWLVGNGSEFGPRIHIFTTYRPVMGKLFKYPLQKDPLNIWGAVEAHIHTNRCANTHTDDVKKTSFYTQGGSTLVNPSKSRDGLFLFSVSFFIYLFFRVLTLSHIYCVGLCEEVNCTERCMFIRFLFHKFKDVSMLN